MELLKALEWVKPGLANKEIIEQSTSFAFMGDRIVTYNDRVSISAHVPGLDLYGAIKAEELYKFLGRLKREEIELEMKDNQVHLKSGKAKAGINIHQKITLPIESNLDDIEWTVLPDDFGDALSLTYPACTKDMAKPKLLGVNVRGDGIIEASDTYQITQYDLQCEIDTEDFLILGTVVRDLCKYGVRKMGKSVGWRHFMTGNDRVIFSSRIFFDSFPDTSAWLADRGTDIILPKNLKESLELSSIFSKSAVEADDMIEIVIENKELIVRAENENGSWFEEPLKIRYDGDPIKFSITPAFLITMLNKSNKCKINENVIMFSGDKWKHVLSLTA